MKNLLIKRLFARRKINKADKSKYIVESLAITIYFEEEYLSLY